MATVDELPYIEPKTLFLENGTKVAVSSYTNRALKVYPGESDQKRSERLRRNYITVKRKRKIQTNRLRYYNENCAELEMINKKISLNIFRLQSQLASKQKSIERSFKAMNRVYDKFVMYNIAMRKVIDRINYKGRLDEENAFKNYFLDDNRTPMISPSADSPNNQSSESKTSSDFLSLSCRNQPAPVICSEDFLRSKLLTKQL